MGVVGSAGGGGCALSCARAWCVSVLRAAQGAARAITVSRRGVCARIRRKLARISMLGETGASAFFVGECRVKRA